MKMAKRRKQISNADGFESALKLRPIGQLDRQWNGRIDLSPNRPRPTWTSLIRMLTGNETDRLAKISDKPKIVALTNRSLVAVVESWDVSASNFNLNELFKQNQRCVTRRAKTAWIVKLISRRNVEVAPRRLILKEKKMVEKQMIGRQNRSKIYINGKTENVMKDGRKKNSVCQLMSNQSSYCETWNWLDILQLIKEKVQKWKT